MLMCAQTHGCAYVQPHTPTRPYVYTPMYVHVRTYTRTRENFSDSKTALQHCQTEFNHQSDTIQLYYPITVQSISILIPHWQRHLYKLSTSAINWHSLSSIIIHSEPLPNHSQSISHLFPTVTHIYLSSSRTHHILSWSNVYPNSPSYQYVSML